MKTEGKNEEKKENGFNVTQIKSNSIYIFLKHTLTSVKELK